MCLINPSNVTNDTLSHSPANWLREYVLQTRKWLIILLLENESSLAVRERPLMMSDFRGEGGSKMTPNNRTLEGKNWTLGEEGVKNRRKLSDIIYVRSLIISTNWHHVVKVAWLNIDNVTSWKIEKVMDLYKNIILGPYNVQKWG